MLEIAILIAAGILLGAFAGLLPGVHPNLFATLFLAASFADPFGTALMLIAASVTNSFVAFVPSVFLGAPEGGNELSILPGHTMLLEGRGYEAVRLTVIGGLLVVAAALVTLPVLAYVVPVLYALARPHLHWLLSGVLLYAFWRDRSVWPVVVVALSGALGLLALENFKEPLFPMLTGLFGTSGLLYSLKGNDSIPQQNLQCEPFSSKSYLSGGLAGYLAGVAVGILPGIGVSQAAYLTQEATRKDKDVRRFLVAIGGVTTADAMFSLLALWLIGNPRSGVAVSVGELLGQVSISEVVAFLGVICFSAAVAAAVTLKIAEFVSIRFWKIEYKTLTLLVLSGLVAAVFLLAEFEGLGILALSTCIGLVAILSGARRSYCMGCLLVPTILFFAGF
ncbi:MAG: tripartite tricarboxylate transporter permease [Candidatus Aenigmatarchaeota archaeon]|nr:MAG: tripartite tricarboxylate transporter permease [Candidatus Aenigmarchaeota archaeon]